jgi:enamine deaminase RidA (YjgF/YER057c/UK114 family)
MVEIEAKLKERGLVLPEPLRMPAGVRLPFAWVRVAGDRAIISGHLPLNPDGTLIEQRGKVGEAVTQEQAADAARLTGLAILASLQRALGDLDRVTGWLRLFGMVNTAPDFTSYPAVINGCSDLILDLYGPERGTHARSAVGLAGLPFGVPVEIEGEVSIA